MLGRLGAVPMQLLLAVLGCSRLATAACECGYSLNKTSDVNHAVFTELVENDFLHASTDNLTKIGWRPQVYNVTAKDARGPYGKDFQLRNVVTNPFKSKDAWSGDAEHGGDAGLELWVRANTSTGFVPGAELTSVRNDALLGSFRVGMKLSNSSGTCGAFFWYYNNSQEIDMEFLSSQFNQSQGYVNLVLQTPESVTHGYDASGTSEFTVQPLPFRPDEKFHEYRFDWTRSRVAFYVDGVFLHEMTNNIPTEGGTLFFNHWSNGDTKWSGGPPARDTVMTISYFKAYFNSTDTTRSQNDYRKRCPNYDAGKVCAIPAQTKPPDVSSGKDGAKTYFFSMEDNMAPGQTVYKASSAASNFGGHSRTAMWPVLIALLSALLIW